MRHSPHNPVWLQVSGLTSTTELLSLQVSAQDRLNKLCEAEREKPLAYPRFYCCSSFGKTEEGIKSCFDEENENNHHWIPSPPSSNPSQIPKKETDVQQHRGASQPVLSHPCTSASVPLETVVSPVVLSSSAGQAQPKACWHKSQILSHRLMLWPLLGHRHTPI